MTKLETEVEAETQRLGRYVWDHIERRKASIFERRWWDDRILSWAMEDESVKVQMFRFVDVLPMLRTHKAITQHLQEYFEEVRSHLPWAARLGLQISQPNSVLGKALAVNARSNARRMASRFIAGSNVEEVMKTLKKIRKQGFAFTLDLLGEAITSETEAERYAQQYHDLITGLAPEMNAMPVNEQIDHDEAGPIPRVNMSIKLSALYSQFKPIDPVGTANGVKERLRPLLRAAREHDAYIHVDMEHYAYKDLTIDIFKQVLMEEEFRTYPDAGIVIQAYLPEAEQDLQELLEWAKQRGTAVTVRLVKGAYWDFETVTAAAHNWPVPVYQQKWESDSCFERCARFLMENYQWLKPALGSHNLRSLSNAVAWAESLKVPKSAYEIQMLYGMGDEQAQVFSELGHRMRIYTPFGELIPGMAYLVRRLLENTSNDSFLRQGYEQDVSIDDLLIDPVTTGETQPPTKPLIEKLTTQEKKVDFTNEPLTDFSQKENQEAMAEALDSVQKELGKEYSLIINGRAVTSRGTLLSRNPSNKKEIVGTVASASPEDASDAIQVARLAFREWSNVETNYRCEYVELIAEEMRKRRFELAAWQVFECGKPWAEADADVAEAIDFCMYYAAHMRRLDTPMETDVPGEENSYFYRPRGVVAVIAPWNFPLAILTGMVSAAIVTGNTVIMKPAEQSPVMAAKLMEIIHSVGIPEGVVSYLPGVGEEVGPELVGSPDVDLIAFTGSRPVGLEINRVAADTDDRQTMVKKVIAEMGGKNAIIVDSDADLDEAVLGVVSSAFGYAGQKCSACSRAIVLEEAYEPFLERLIEATKSLNVGPAVDPANTVGPVIDEDSVERIQSYIKIGKEENTLVLECPVGDLKEQGYFVGPHIFADVDPSSRLAQEEIFGPVLVVLKVKTLQEAIDMANDTDYALTGGLFSRSPANLKKVRQELQVGNLYLNRGITGALVDRQPFGGYRMSGIGTKAGGPDYLLEFLIPVSVTENTMRRGFAPATESDAEKDEGS